MCWASTHPADSATHLMGLPDEMSSSATDCTSSSTSMLHTCAPHMQASTVAGCEQLNPTPWYRNAHVIEGVRTTAMRHAVLQQQLLGCLVHYYYYYYLVLFIIWYYLYYYYLVLFIVWYYLVCDCVYWHKCAVLNESRYL
jgi:hypothetical protein